MMTNYQEFFLKKILLTILICCSLFGAYEYNFYRPYDSANNCYLIDSPVRTNADGTQIHLAYEVEQESVLSGEMFILVCEGTNAKFIFQDELNGVEENKLEDIVADHTNNN